VRKRGVVGEKGGAYRRSSRGRRVCWRGLRSVFRGVLSWGLGALWRRACTWETRGVKAGEWLMIWTCVEGSPSVLEAGDDGSDEAALLRISWAGVGVFL